MTVARLKRRFSFIINLNPDSVINIFKIRFRVIRGAY
jgi:hypothetical protein